ncbi:MAG: DEAD/DEAH box helicase [Bacteroidales bacterium]|nr:DEAD/DEAH box helicase [Bacteroidales bacterium]
MAQKFGNTWWGQEWLKALNSIDYENRIPRGASYARKGAVKGLKIRDNVIEAKVQGSRLTPYKEMIVLPKFENEKIDLLIDKLMRKPAVLTALFQGQLLPQVAEMANSCGIKLFPTKWSDLKMNCNCPDWAVPCKHLAAVVYMVSREIDNNPFLVFEMHGIDLLHLLTDRGLNLTRNKSAIKPTKVRDLFSNKTSKELPPTMESVAESASVDFSLLQGLNDSMLKLLPDNPPFYVNGNFKGTYEEEYRRIVRGANSFLQGKTHAQSIMGSHDQPQILSQDIEISIEVNGRLDYVITLADLERKFQITRKSLALALLAIDPDELTDYHLTVRVMHQALYAAIHMMSHGMFKAQILQRDDNFYSVRWIPTVNEEQCAHILDAIDQMAGGPMIHALVGPRNKAQDIDGQSLWLVSMFMGIIVNALASAKADNEIGQLFFQGTACKFNGVGQVSIPGAIKTWLDSMDVAEAMWRPTLFVADEGEEYEKPFTLRLGIESYSGTETIEVMLDQVLTDSAWESRRLDVLQGIMHLSSVIGDLDRYIDNNAQTPIRLGDEELVELITHVIPAICSLGLKVFMPKSLNHLLKPKVTVKLDTNFEGEGLVSMSDFFTYKWQVAIGNQLIDPAEFEKLLANASGLIRFKKSYIYVSPDDLVKLRDRLYSDASLTTTDIFKAALSEEFEDAPVSLSDSAKKLMEQLRQAPEVALPQGLNATMRPYQERGFSWLYRNMKVGFGSILADDMGLGKTLQAISLILKLKEEGHLDQQKALIIAPVGLLYNWQAEIRRFAPSLVTSIYHGGAREIKACQDSDVVITSYGIARSDAAKIKKGKWQLLVIDEAQNIKNPKTAQAKAVNSIKAACRIALSGTPVENRLAEFWSIMNFTNVGYLGTLSKFGKDFAKPIQVYNDKKCAEDLKKITAPFLLRRMKTDKNIISDLPDKVETDVYSNLSPQQAALYQQTLTEAMAVIEKMPTDNQQALFKRQGIILQMILALKQICDHPALFLKNDDIDVALSGKAQLLLDRVQSIVDAGEKVLIFTQYREMGAILETIIQKHLQQKTLFLHGGCTIEQRKEMVDKFQRSREHKIFILSLKAAGTGLNLTAASHVIHYDLWWNPAVEAQATDRAYRIGQTQNVFVDRLITQGTFEEKINDMINRKRNLAEMTVSNGETWLGNLSNSELHEIFDR